MQKRRISVPVATVWTSPSSFRPIDASAVSKNPDMKTWLSAMTREETIALCSEKRTQTQVLFNDPIIIDEINGEWARVVVPDQYSSRDKRGYPGWMPVSQSILCNRSEAYESVMVQSKTAILYNETNQPIFELSFGTFLPAIAETDHLVQVDTPIGTGILHKKDLSFPARRSSYTGTDIVHVALKFLDLPYLWAGMSAYGYDCSGYSYSMLRAGGYLIPRDADDQSAGGRAIVLKSVLPGDLLFFAYEKGSGEVHHVGIYFGEGKMIHSQTPGKKVTITALKGTIYEQELCAIRRYWKEG
ncbi:C40 family peptidase [Sporolactobacillus shoreicorticis]|uniref:NlpC/P60 family protein n=1 Tax=Sporolactobacillus shoreicorticis TaxID=1923877 RepID=A0ABW5S5Y9_9BACL|nr:C40 family peptidase [Sporolactobacillus shoreicorticis]MCO7125714.1 C40 family peptidase [Sporolactobacillus shoreicorticis]